MPTWTAPRTWDNELVEASDFNIELRDNQLAIKDPPSDNYEADKIDNYESASSTFANIDVNGFTNFSITTNGGDVMVGCIVSTNGGGSGWIDVNLDGTRIINESAAGLLRLNVCTGSFCWLVAGLAAGVHTFNFQFRYGGVNTLVIPAGAGTANYDLHPQFWVREIS